MALGQQAEQFGAQRAAGHGVKGTTDGLLRDQGPQWPGWVNGWPSLRHARNASVRERWTKVHALHACPSCRRFAQTAGTRRGVQDSANECLSARPLLGIKDGFSLSVRIGIAVLDDPARPLANEPSVQHEHGAVGLISP